MQNRSRKENPSIELSVFGRTWILRGNPRMNRFPLDAGLIGGDSYATGFLGEERGR